MKSLMIVNPASGAGYSLKILPKIKKCFEKNKYDLVFTSKNNCKSIAKNNTKYDLLIVVGGDGTINEVINGIMQSKKKPAIAIIPSGTGNAYARTIAAPRHIKQICEKIDKPKFKKVDVIHLKKPNLYAIAFFGFGFDANVLSLRNFMRISGIKGYILPCLWTMLRMIKYNMHIHLNVNTFTTKLIQLVISNSPYYGGGLLLCPNAKVDDGLLDITTYNFSRLQFVKNCRGVFSGKKHKKIKYYKSKNIRIAVKHKIPMQYDGQLMKTKQKTFNLEILPKAIKVVWFG
ncbi:YegS/Rv2252/BmrU family lipid kinase [Candidatus Woesearchaeota archaeon]|nr:YegS/Rv2252/BmrU family lipid kinase [Candidatus Woesearchaeota archaeon]